eukprot:6383881-Ditylum_brightwellii.AAC.1
MSRRDQKEDKTNENTGERIRVYTATKDEKEGDEIKSRRAPSQKRKWDYMGEIWQMQPWC